MEALPLYRQIYNDLLAKIRDGTYLENKSLPAERVRCHMYHVSRSTIRRTLDELQRDGYIVKAQGNGNFVKPKVFDQKLTKFHSFASSLKEQHILIRNQILDYELIEADRYLESLEVVRAHTPAGSRWHKLTRLRSAETFPLMIETSYLLQSRFLALKPEVLKDGSLYAYLEAYYGMEITDAYETLSPLLPTAKERLLLQIPTHVPCMLCERFCYEQQYLTIIHRTVVRGDKFKFKAAYYTDEAITDIG